MYGRKQVWGKWFLCVCVCAKVLNKARVEKKKKELKKKYEKEL